jgi:hypothetical protein
MCSHVRVSASLCLLNVALNGCDLQARTTNEVADLLTAASLLHTKGSRNTHMAR